jgi:hypothetical protein
LAWSPDIRLIRDEGGQERVNADERRALITKLNGGSLEAAFDAFAKERDAYRVRAMAAEKALAELRRSVTAIFDQWQREGSGEVKSDADLGEAVRLLGLCRQFMSRGLLADSTDEFLARVKERVKGERESHTATQEGEAHAR